MLGVVGGLAITYLGIMIYEVIDETRPRPYEICCQTPADWGYEFEDVRLDGDGVTLAGWYIPSRNRAAVLLLHPGGSSRLGVAAFARLLAENGYGVLLYDRRANGESTGDRLSRGWKDVPDVAAAIEFLTHRDDVDARRLGVFGASIGGQVALRAAARHEELRAVIADGPSLCSRRDAPSGGTFEFRLMKASHWVWELLFQRRLNMKAPPAVVEVIGEISPRPVFLISAGGVERHVTESYFDHAQEPKTLWVIPEADHGQTWGKRPDEYPKRFLAFFDQTLLASSSGPSDSDRAELPAG